MWKEEKKVRRYSRKNNRVILTFTEHRPILGCPFKRQTWKLIEYMKGIKGAVPLIDDPDRNSSGATKPTGGFGGGGGRSRHQGRPRYTEGYAYHAQYYEEHPPPPLPG